MPHILQERFAATLIDWHAHHGRHALPWQNTRDPYRIWLSEIMLQQTQVETVIPYYERFLERFPDVHGLAQAPLETVLELWSGLGYYARARNLHRAALRVCNEHGGRFPPDAEQLQTLPGIGRSTAAAIAAFAYEERAAILDGNVRRVLCRAFGIEGFPGERKIETQLWELAETLLPDRAVAAYTQAQMDLGATVCTRARPRCEHCPLRTDCVARQQGRVTALPTPRPRRQTPTRRVRVALIDDGEHVLLERRPPSGIWGGLLTLPEVPDAVDDEHAWLQTQLGLSLTPEGELDEIRHTFTHFRLHMQPLCFHARKSGTTVREPNHIWLERGAWDSAAVPAPVRRLLQNLSRPTPFARA